MDLRTGNPFSSQSIPPNQGQRQENNQISRAFFKCRKYLIEQEKELAQIQKDYSFGMLGAAPGDESWHSRTFLFAEAMLFILQVLVNPDQRRDSPNAPSPRAAAPRWKCLLEMQMTPNLISQRSSSPIAATPQKFHMNCRSNPQSKPRGRA